MTEEVNIEHAFETAYSSLTATDQQWLTKERFDLMCSAVTSGTKERNLYKVLGQTRKVLKGQKGEQTRRLKKIFGSDPVQLYVNLLSEPDAVSWTDWIGDMRVKAQGVLRETMDGTADGMPTKEATKVAMRMLDQEVGRPTENIKVERTDTITFRGMEEIASAFPVGLLSSPANGDAEVVDVEVVDVGEGGRGAGIGDEPGDATLRPEPRAVDGSPLPEPVEADGGGRVGREESPSGPRPVDST
jgi:hypothetical protein